MAGMKQLSAGSSQILMMISGIKTTPQLRRIPYTSKVRFLPEAVSRLNLR
jgi:hypothetical protein